MGIEEVLDEREGLGMGYAEVNDVELLMALGLGQDLAPLAEDGEVGEVGALSGEDDVVDGVEGDFLAGLDGRAFVGVVDGEHVGGETAPVDGVDDDVDLVVEMRGVGDGRDGLQGLSHPEGLYVSDRTGRG